MEVWPGPSTPRLTSDPAGAPSDPAGIPVPGRCVQLHHLPGGRRAQSGGQDGVGDAVRRPGPRARPLGPRPDGTGLPAGVALSWAHRSRVPGRASRVAGWERARSLRAVFGLRDARLYLRGVFRGERAGGPSEPCQPRSHGPGSRRGGDRDTQPSA